WGCPDLAELAVRLAVRHFCVRPDSFAQRHFCKKGARMKPALLPGSLWAVLAAVFLVLPFAQHDYLLGIGLSFLMWLALTQSWSVLSSMTGYISLGHVVFYGLGSYTVVVSWQQLPLWV